MIKAFNAFQMVAMFACAPFVISWVRTATFSGAQVAFYTGIAIYAVAFIAMCGAILSVIERD